MLCGHFGLWAHSQTEVLHGMLGIDWQPPPTQTVLRVAEQALFTSCWYDLGKQKIPSGPIFVDSTLSKAKLYTCGTSIS